MIVGYARVSTQDQHLELQRDALNAANCERIFEDKMSGAKAARPGLTEALEFLRAGDTLVIWKLSRLGRTMKQLIETVQLLEEKGRQLRSLHESIDTTTATGKLLFHMVAAFAQFERDNMIENTKAGLQAARARGRKGGRPRKLDAQKVQLAKDLRKDHSRSIKEICELLQISRATFYTVTTEPAPAPDESQAH